MPKRLPIRRDIARCLTAHLHIYLYEPSFDPSRTASRRALLYTSAADRPLGLLRTVRSRTLAVARPLMNISFGSTRPSAYVLHGTYLELPRTKQARNPRLVFFHDVDHRPRLFRGHATHGRPHGQQTTGRTTNVHVIDLLNASSQDTRVARV